jgi:hypothetical protein
MFARLKTFLLGEKRTIVRSVTHPVVGDLVYSADDEAWLTDPKASKCSFGFFISADPDETGLTIQPSVALIDHAAEIASQPEVFVDSVRELVQSQLKTVKSLHANRDEIEKLQICRVALMWPDRPYDGEIELRTSPNSDRMWHCAYAGRKPSPPLVFSGLDE